MTTADAERKLGDLDGRDLFFEKFQQDVEPFVKVIVAGNISYLSEDVRGAAQSIAEIALNLVEDGECEENQISRYITIVLYESFNKGFQSSRDDLSSMAIVKKNHVIGVLCAFNNLLAKRYRVVRKADPRLKHIAKEFLKERGFGKDALNGFSEDLLETRISKHSVTGINYKINEIRLSLTTELSELLGTTAGEILSEAIGTEPEKIEDPKVRELVAKIRSVCFLMDHVEWYSTFV